MVNGRLRGRVVVAALLLAGILPVGGLAAAPIDLLPPVVGVSELQSADPRTALGLFGYDPVGMLVDGVARPGSPAFEVLHEGTAWRFASAPNLAAFLRDPASFLPRIGGYDALAGASGRLAKADPTVFAVLDGRLYLFRGEGEKARFLADGGAVAAAERGWQGLSRDLVRR